MLKRIILIAAAVSMCAAVLTAPAGAKATLTAAKEKVKWVNAVDPKPLSKNVNRGLAWLAKQQLPSGAWGQGEESAQMGRGMKMKDTPSMADTCMAALALIRSGSTPAKGPYAGNVLKAVRFVCAEIEKPPKDSLYVTKTRNTRIQSKLGPYIDTFLASLLLNEVQDRMPDAKGTELASAALDKALHKMKTNQRKHGTWGDKGWAPVLAQGFAVKGLNGAAQRGKVVGEVMLARAEKYSQDQYNGGRFGSSGSAGVQLYSSASNLAAIQDSANTNATRIVQARKLAKTAATQPARDAAAARVARYERNDKVLKDAKQSVIKRLDDKRFIAGFGSNGGEEFLSYMNIGESLVVDGGKDWAKWDKKITQNLNRIQNKDGSWTGHHCITGRTVCTSAALLVLMVDRSQVPLSAKIKQR